MARELTREEKAKIRKLVTKWCANYDKECGCLPLDCECYMLGKCWTGSYCRYFRDAVLPLDPVLEAGLTAEGPAPETRLCRSAAASFSRTAGRATAPRPVPRKPTAASSGIT